MKALMIVVAICAALLATAFLFPPRQDVMSTAQIEAPPAKVWSVLIDTKDYPAWNPEIPALKGNLVPGAVLENHEGRGDEEMVFHPVVLAVTPDRELRWLGQIGFKRFFGAEHYFILEPYKGGTYFTQGEHLRGVLLWFFDPSRLEPGFAAMNQALKSRAEAIRASD